MQAKQGTHGIWTALVTPFDENQQLDLPAFRALLREQKAAQVNGVIPCGSTGEAVTLTLQERMELIRTTLEELKDSSVQVYAGTGTNDTQESIQLSRWASDQGVDGVLVVTPYYNKPSQSGLENHFLAIADQIECDLMLYNVPGRTGVSLTPQTIAKLARHPRIRSLNEATGDLGFLSSIFDELGMQNLSLNLLSGDDATFLPALCLGATGVVSVTSNLIPQAMVELYSAFHHQDIKRARQLHRKYYPLFRDLFIESNPTPIKFALEQRGLCRSWVRRPLAPLTEQSQEILQRSLKRCGLDQTPSV
ncbi:MAG: 4-hydroxy-tetrahydrodipicolinate synthase [Bdellovibrionia bacterium]